MAQCKWCGKKGFFLSLTENGLCEKCNSIVVKDILDNGRIFQESVHELNYFIIPKLGLELIYKIKTSLSILKQYEDKSIPTISPLPSELLNKKIYGSQDESIDKIESRLNNENGKFNRNVLTLDILLRSHYPARLKGDFDYDEITKCFVQFCKSNPTLTNSSYDIIHKIEIEFSEDYKSGFYREYWLSNNLRREVHFVKESDSTGLSSDGNEKIYYEGLNSSGEEEVYVLIEENQYKMSQLCGISKRYSIDGGLMAETDWDTMTDSASSLFYGIERREYYPESGRLKLEEHKEWGKEYYPGQSLKAEWTNKNYMKSGVYTEYHKNGNVKMTVNYVLIDGIGTRDGIMNKYFQDGKISEIWGYNNGKRIFVKKYFTSGVLKTEWLYDDKGNEISKKYFNEKGVQIKK